MRYLQETKDYKLTYKRYDHLEVVKYSDSDFAGCADSRKSTLGYVFLLAEEAISWRSVKQSLVATSTTEAEFVSYFEATSQASWLRSFISGLQIVDSISKPLKIYCDNSIVVFLVTNNKSESESESHSRYIDIKYLKLREHVSSKLSIDHISTRLMIRILWWKNYHLRLIRSVLSIWDSVLFCNWDTLYICIAFGRYENPSWFKFVFLCTVCIHKVEWTTILNRPWMSIWKLIHKDMTHILFSKEKVIL